jgi:hypothetical protein
LLIAAKGRTAWQKAVGCREHSCLSLVANGGSEMIRPPRTKHVLVSVGLIQLSATQTSATAAACTKEGHSYKPLPAEFRHDGFQYGQIARESDCAIYEQRWSGCRNRSVCYEVIRIRRREGFQIGGRAAADDLRAANGIEKHAFHLFRPGTATCHQWRNRGFDFGRRTANPVSCFEPASIGKTVCVRSGNGGLDSYRQH